MTQLTIIKPDDWHLHLRDGEMLKAVLPFTTEYYARSIIMPNLTPPLTTIDAVISYRNRILEARPNHSTFEPLMTLYLSDDSDPDEIKKGFEAGIIKAAKLYPAHATTNSAHGVSSIDKIRAVLETMQALGMPLLIHGESTDKTVDVFDREAAFIEATLIPILNAYPNLKIVLEHISTKEAAEFILEGSNNLAATVTPQHLLLNRNEIFKGGINPHRYCLPILKRETHRIALAKAVTSGCDRFFLGTDSAPHPNSKKESACGCAGMFNAVASLPVYAQIFEQHNALHHLEAFTSLNGPRFYGLPINKDKMTLTKKPFKMPDNIPLPNGEILTHFLAGEVLDWTVEV